MGVHTYPRTARLKLAVGVHTYNPKTARLRSEGYCRLKDSLGYRVSPCLKFIGEYMCVYRNK